MQRCPVIATRVVLLLEIDDDVCVSALGFDSRAATGSCERARAGRTAEFSECGELNLPFANRVKEKMSPAIRLGGGPRPLSRSTEAHRCAGNRLAIRPQNLAGENPVGPLEDQRRKYIAVGLRVFRIQPLGSRTVALGGDL